MLNYDFKVFWKGRLIFLREYLSSQQINYYAIELFGKGSPYSFDSYDNNEDWWTCLFPVNSATEVPVKKLKQSLFKALDVINPDVVIASSIVFFAGALGLKWTKRNKKKFIMFENAKPSQFKRNFLTQSIKNILSEQADGLWLPSPDYDKEYPELLNKGVHFFYGYCAVNNDLFKIKEKNEFNNNRIICTARLVPIKNIDNLLRAWQIVEQKNKDCKLTIIGNGSEFEKLKAFSIELKLNNVDFLGKIDNKNIPAFIRNSDAFILPSLSETWGLVVNEAMAAGMPVLLSNKINAAHTLLEEGKNGYSFDPLNTDQMADVILKYINLDISAKINMSQKSLEIIETMSYEQMGSKLAEALNKINSQDIKKTSLLASIIVNLWDGRYSTSAWDKL